MLRRVILLCLGIVLCAAGCSRDPDWKQVGDENVTENLFATHGGTSGWRSTFSISRSTSP